MAVMAVGAAPAAAAGWTDLPAPNTPSQMQRPSVVADAAGHLTAAWADYTGVQFRVLAVSRDPLTGWGDPEVLVTSATRISDPVVAGDPEGRAVVAWTRCGTGWRAQAAVRSDDGDWGAATDLASAGSCTYTNTHAAAAVDTAGRFVVSWTEGVNLDAQAATLAPSGPWSAPTTIGPAGEGHALAATADGHVLAAWSRYIGGLSYAVEVADRAADQTWGAPVNVTTTSTNAFSPVIAAAGGRRALLAWHGTAALDGRAWAVARDEDGDWATPAVVSGAATDVREVTVAADADDDALVAWRTDTGLGAVHGTSGALGPIETPDGGGVTPRALAAALDAGGAPAVAFAGARAGLTRYAGAWEPALLLDPVEPASGAPALVTVPGAEIVARAQGTGTVYDSVVGGRLRVSVRDARPPALSVTVAGSAVAGAPVPLGAEAPDAWSAVGEITWEFGDGGTGAGDAPTHVYAAPGTYPVTVRAEDAAGNVATSAFDLVVAAAPEPPGPSAPQPEPAPAAPPPPPAAAPTPTPAPAPAPRPALAVPAVLRVGPGPLSLPLTCRGARCTVRVSVSAGRRTLAVASRSLAAGARARLSLPLGAAARRALARSPRTRATVVVSARVDGTWRVTSRRPVTLVPAS